MTLPLYKLFLELALPNKEGISRWVSVEEFTGKYEVLKFGNGGSWVRKNSSLCKKYNVELDKSVTPGNSIDRIRLIGINNQDLFNQSIRKDIIDVISAQKCVMLGVKGNSENTIIEVDHKDGRKDNLRVSTLASQKLSDFQPLCKAANNIKRQICKNCKRTDKRWDAKNIIGNPFSFYEGDENYTKELGCVGCYQYDPVAYRLTSACRITNQSVTIVLSQLFPEIEPEELKKYINIQQCKPTQ